MIKKVVSKTILVLLIISMLTLAFKIELVSAIVPEYPAIYVDPAEIIDPTLIPGTSFTIAIKTDYMGDDITAYQFTLSYNPDVLNGVSVTNGDIIDFGLYFFNPGTFDNVAGTLSLTGAFFFTAGDVAPGPGTLATVTFEVVGTGCSDIILGPETNLYGWNFIEGDEYKIIEGDTMPDHLGHGYFCNIPSIHDVAIIDLVAPATAILGDIVPISVTITNEGGFNETFDVLVSYNSTAIETRSVFLAVEATATELFNWNTSGVGAGTYSITAEAILTEDENPSDNTATKPIEFACIHTWNYRKSHVINSASGAGTNYQIKIKTHYGSGTDSGQDVYLNGHSRQDFGDVRFTDDDSITELDYWMEEKVDSDYAIFWVEVNKDLTSQSQTIYIYYGKPLATTTSNGAYTFLFFDDCEDLSRWTEDYSSGTPIFEQTTIDGYSVIRLQTNAHEERIYIKSTTTVPRAKAIVSRVKHISFNRDSYHRFRFHWVNSTNWMDYHDYESYFDRYQLRKMVNGSHTIVDTYSVAHPYGWYTYEVYDDGTNIDVNRNTTDILDGVISDAALDSDGYLYITNYQYNEWGTSELAIDQIFVRNYVDPEPSHGSWGAEEPTSTVPEYPAIYVDPAEIIDPTLIPGTSFTIAIKTDYSGDDITAYQFTLSYDPSILNGVSVTNGDLIVDGSAMFLPGTFDNTAGELSLTGAFFFFTIPPPEVASGPGTLAYVTFTVVGTGCSDIILGPETNLYGWSLIEGDEYKIIEGDTMPDHLGHGYFCNVAENLPPIANFTYSPTFPYVGQAVTFDASESSDPDGTIVSYEWDFGDGSTGTGALTPYIYESAGTFTVTLTVTDDLGATDTLQQEITVDPSPTPTILSVHPIDISDPTLGLGSTFRINITVASVEKLWGYEFVLNYNTTVLSATDFGIYLPFENIIPAGSGINDTEGNVYLAAYTYMTDPDGLTTTDPAPIAWIEFIVDNVGISILDLNNSKLSDPSGNPILHVNVDGFFDNRHDIMATIDINPDTLNLKSEDQWVICYIELSEGYDVGDIDVSTVMLNGEIQAELNSTEIGDYDEDGVPDLMVRFDRGIVESFIYNQGTTYGEVALTITGNLTDGTAFEGTDIISVNYAGDANKDGIIDIFDLGAVSAHWYPGPPTGPLGYISDADFNNDGAVDIFDVGILSVNWGETTPPP